MCPFLLPLPWYNNILLAHSLSISTAGHLWPHFTALNESIFARPASVGSRLIPMWGDESLLPLSEGPGTRGVVQCPRPREMHLSEVCRASLLVLHLSYLPSC